MEVVGSRRDHRNPAKSMKTLKSIGAILAFVVASCATDSTVKTEPTAWDGVNPLDLPGGDDPSAGLWRYNNPHFRLFSEDYGHR
jgi:hypothetical protein